MYLSIFESGFHVSSFLLFMRCLRTEDVLSFFRTWNLISLSCSRGFCCLTVFGHIWSWAWQHHEFGTSDICCQRCHDCCQCLVWHTHEWLLQVWLQVQRLLCRKRTLPTGAAHVVVSELFPKGLKCYGYDVFPLKERTKVQHVSPLCQPGFVTSWDRTDGWL